MKGITLLALGGLLFLAGLALVYGGFVTKPLGDTGLQIREVTLSPGIGLMGVGLYLVFRGLRKLLR